MLRPLTLGAKEILTFFSMTLSEEEKNLFKAVSLLVST